MVRILRRLAIASTVIRITIPIADRAQATGVRVNRTGARADHRGAAAGACRNGWLTLTSASLRGQPMLKLETKSDLERLKNDDIQASVTLDYKDAAALGKTSPQRSELCKDVSAFANSAGGQIIYGIEEQGHHPVRVQTDDAIDPADISREWVEQVIDSNVQPRIQNLRIQPIDVAPGRVAYVITIPPATTNAPHQAPDNRYYYRQNFQSVPMEDYQVRDTMRRATTPELYVCLSLPRGKTAGIEFAHQAEMSKPITLNVFVGNR